MASGTRFQSCTRAALLAGLLCAPACAGGVTDTTPDGGIDTTDTNPPGSVQRASITVEVSFDPQDASLAQSAGVELNGLTVRLQRSGSTDAPQTATTDASGKATFEQLLEGTYVASIERTLSAAELSKLSPPDREVSVFAGGGQVTLVPPTSRTLPVAVVGARRGSLVISERFGYRHKSPAYPYGDYLEVYNNSDTTIYLDGVVLFHTGGSMHTDSWGPCSHYTDFREDPERIWARAVVIFPGSGREFPIHPGEAKVIAQDALDHQTLSGNGLYQNLSKAHFESIGTEADTDNPVSANMIRGFNASLGGFGRGPNFPPRVTWGLARPGATTGAATDTIVQVVDNGSPNFPGKAPAIAIARADILDVFSTTSSPAVRAFLNSINFGSHECPIWLSPVFERGVAFLDDDDIPDAIRRKALGTTPEGRIILQRTRTSARDLERGPPLRRSLNK